MHTRLEVLWIRVGLEVASRYGPPAARPARPARRVPPLAATLAAAGVLLAGIGLGGLTAPGSAVARTGYAETARPPSESPVREPPDAAAEGPAPHRADPAGSTRATPGAAAGLRIPTIGVDIGLQQLALQADGELAPPSSAAQAGWYTGSAAPGEVGPAVVVGHVDSREGPGVFFRLKELQPGAAISLRRSDGRWVDYRVSAVDFFAKDAFPTERIYRPTPDPEVRLITCGGPFDYSTRNYRDNVVVYAAAG